jgi:phage terminase Nu1 subunit (DNA packaging protein)
MPDATPITPIMVDERQAAAMLGMTPRTLQQWRRDGIDLPYVRVSSRCVRYRVVDLERWAAARLRTSTADNGGAAAVEPASEPAEQSRTTPAPAKPRTPRKATSSRRRPKRRGRGSRSS